MGPDLALLGGRGARSPSRIKRNAKRARPGPFSRSSWVHPSSLERVCARPSIMPQPPRASGQARAAGWPGSRTPEMAHPGPPPGKANAGRFRGMPRRTIGVRFPRDLDRKLDERAAALGVARSQLIVEAVRKSLENRSAWSPGFLAAIRTPRPELVDATDEMLRVVRRRRTRNETPASIVRSTSAVKRGSSHVLTA